MSVWHLLTDIRPWDIKQLDWQCFLKNMFLQDTSLFIKQYLYSMLQSAFHAKFRYSVQCVERTLTQSTRRSCVDELLSPSAAVSRLVMQNTQEWFQSNEHTSLTYWTLKKTHTQAQKTCCQTEKFIPTAFSKHSTVWSARNTYKTHTICE